MDKINIKISFEQFKKAMRGELVELIPGKKGYSIYLYPDGKHYKYIKLGIIKYSEIFVHNMRLETIKELQKWFLNQIISEKNCDISIGIMPKDCEIDKNAIIIYCKADSWYISYLDTKIIAKICIVKMSLN